MTFLYVGLGLAMISGISAMIQIGNNVNNLSLLSTFKQNRYYESILPIYDRRIIDILNNYSGPDSDICSNINENLSDISYTNGELPKSSSTQKTNALFNEINCVLVNRDIRHRVLINKTNLGTFNLFSCYLEPKNTYCSYELE